MRTRGSQLLYSLADQVLYSGSNIAFLLVVARITDGTAFGQFTISYSLYIIAVGLSRAFVTDPLLIAPISPGLLRARSRGILTAALLFGVAGGLLLISLLTVLAWSPREAITFGSTIPTLALQDAYRAISFYERTAGRVLVMDGIWAFIQFGLTGVLAIRGELTVVTATVAWAVGALGSALSAAQLSRHLPGRGARSWLRDRWTRGSAMAVEFLSGQGAAQVSLLAVAAVLGPVGVSTLRIIQVAFGPINMVTQGMYGWAMPRLSNSLEVRRLRLGWKLAVALSFAATTFAMAILLCPKALLVAIFGKPWIEVTPLLLAILAADRILATISGPLAWTARAQGNTAALAWGRTMTGVLSVAGCTAMAAGFGVNGAAIGTLVAGALFTAISAHLARKVRS